MSVLLASSTKSNDITDSSLNSYSEIEETEADLDEESLVEKESQLSEISDNEDEPMETSCKIQYSDMEAAVVSSQPYQSTSQNIIVNTKKLESSRYRQSSTEWYRAYPWVVLASTSSRPFCYMCKYCYNKGYLLDKYVDKAFVSTGFNNWKKAHERFKLHSKSNCHRESVIKISQIKSAPDIGAQLDKQLKENQQLHRRMLLKQLSYQVSIY